MRLQRRQLSAVDPWISRTPTGWLVTASFIDLEMEIWMENDGHIKQVAAK